MLFRNLLLATGTAVLLSAQVPDFTPPTPLIGSIMRSDVAETKRLLASGADPNEGRFLGATPVVLALMMQIPEAAKALIAKGADVKATGMDGVTTLMFAAANEAGNPEIVNHLLQLGVDPNASNKAGETALDWALRRGHTQVVQTLKAHGANEFAPAKRAIEKAVALLQKSGPEFSKVSTCSSCHHQSLPQMAYGMARERGFAVDAKVSEQQVKSVIAMFRPIRERMLEGKENLPDPAITVTYSLLGLHAEGYKPDPTTEAMAYLVSTQQNADGSFRILAARPPMESSVVTGTALSLRALQLYGKDADARVARARDWLRGATARTTEESAMQLLGLAWAKAEHKDLANPGKRLLAQQRPDGGWAQLPGLESDAYATGQALVALQSAGRLKAADEAFQRGVEFLVRTQRPDGSWLVRTRSMPIQPYKESGFPHGKDQWISAAGTSWAAMALTLSTPLPAQLSQVVSGAGN